MADALERFFNQQSDKDDSWGPFLYLRPPKTQRMTLRLWAALFGFIFLFTVPLGAVLGFCLTYYDYATVQHHDTKIPPVVVTERWINHTSPATVLFYSALAIATALSGCVGQHWAWNRRADRLNREAILPLPVAAAVPGAWPPPPAVSAGDLPKV